jgi:type I restriction enzyme R subunit
MPRNRGTETTFELTTIERLEREGYVWQSGPDIQRPHDEAVLRSVLRANLASRYPSLVGQPLDQAVAYISRPEGVDTIRRNMTFHAMLVRGFDLQVEQPNGKKTHIHIHPIDWHNAGLNDWQVINQLPIHGQNDRRPDILLYVNGLPLVLFELKNPYSDQPTVDDAYNQVQHYRYEIPQLFDYNALVVISDGVTTLHGMWSASDEWYAPWKSIDGREIEPNSTGSMKTLVEGLLPKERLLQYIRDFIVFEVANDRIEKKGAKYHQFFAVRLAAAKTIDTYRAEGDKRIGVIWHTTGSGKSLSMAFLVGMLRRAPELQNPTFVIQVDRTDLDSQLHDQFVAAKSLVGDVKHAESVVQLRDMLRTEGGEVIFTTIEKFRLQTDIGGKPIEVQHPVLSERSNLVVIADEAHRSQYGFLEGYARNLAEALPNARRIGFTGTPISFSGADTVEVFGEVIHTYDIRQSQEDHATVPIFYAPQQIRLHLKHNDIDGALREISQEHPVTDLERRKVQWAALAAAAGAKERVQELAQDLLSHFLDRSATLLGKAMIVCMTRANCVALYDAMKSLPGCPEIKVVMTGNLGEDPPEWARDGHLTTKSQREIIKRRMVDVDDPLKIVIVCDMWLTGTDIPCLHTLYVDKPMQGHNMIQAISRVNRVFRDKPHGLIVDYIGIGDDLREATGKYTSGGGKGEPAPEVGEQARPVFMACIADIRKLLPEGQDYGGWRRITRIEMEDLYALVYGHLAEDDDLRNEYLAVELRLTSAFLLVKHLDDCRVYADEVIFYQRVRKQIAKALPGKRPQRDLERAVRDLVDDAVESEGVVDIFKAAGIEKADLSILDDKFLQTFKDRPLENLRLKLLEQLLRDEIQLRQKKNLAKARSFREMLEATLKKYHNRLIDAAAVVNELIRIRKEMDGDDIRAAELKLEPEELAFYDAVTANAATIYDQAFLRDLIHDVVRVIKRNLKVDWTQPHREDVKAEIRASVKRVLRTREVRVEDFEAFLEQFMTQAVAMYADWPSAA